jgi:hypothetical protein
MLKFFCNNDKCCIFVLFGDRLGVICQRIEVSGAAVLLVHEDAKIILR